MEFPGLGQHCSNPDCSRLDFLPVKCGACNKIFCKDHYLYASHNCPLAYTKDIQVPVCPLCNQPVPVNKGESPDEKVSRHMDNDCKFEKRVKRSNRCSVRGCKVAELIPVVCPRCKKNYCLKHRHEQDHNCQPYNRIGSANATRSNNAPKQSTLSMIGSSLNRERQERRQRQQLSSGNSNRYQPSTQRNYNELQNHMSDDEALALAMQASLQDSSTSHQVAQSSKVASRHQEDADKELAQAIAASLQDSNRPHAEQKKSESKFDCVVS